MRAMSLSYQTMLTVGARTLFYNVSPVWRAIFISALFAVIFPCHVSAAAQDRSDSAKPASIKRSPASTTLNVRIVAPIPTPQPEANAFYSKDAFWVSVGSIGSFLAAAATVALAVYTSRLAFRTKELAEETRMSIGDTRTAMAAEDRRHRDMLQPHVAIVAEEAQPGVWNMLLWNIGPGYAKDLKIEATMPIGTRAINIPVALPASGRIAYYRTSGDRVFPSDITITYRDAFGNNFVSQVAGQFVPGKSYDFRSE